MENSLTVINIISAVVCFISVFFIVRYFKKDTLLYLIGYAVSSVGMCALNIASIMILSNFDKSYKENAVYLCIFVMNFFLAVFLMKEWFDKHKKNITIIIIKIIDTDDEDTESK